MPVDHCASCSNTIHKSTTSKKMSRNIEQKDIHTNFLNQFKFNVNKIRNSMMLTFISATAMI